MASIHRVRSEDTIRRFALGGIDVAAGAELLLEAEVADVEGVPHSWYSSISSRALMPTRGQS
jgi:hypothetical protein